MAVTGRAVPDEPRLERDEVRGRRGGDELSEPSLRAAQTSCSFSLRPMNRSSSSCSSSRRSSGSRARSSWLISQDRYWSTASWLDLAKRDCLLPMASGGGRRARGCSAGREASTEAGRAGWWCVVKGVRGVEQADAMMRGNADGARMGNSDREASNVHSPTKPGKGPVYTAHARTHPEMGCERRAEGRATSCCLSSFYHGRPIHGERPGAAQQRDPPIGRAGRRRKSLNWMAFARP